MIDLLLLLSAASQLISSTIEREDVRTLLGLKESRVYAAEVYVEPRLGAELNIELEQVLKLTALRTKFIHTKALFSGYTWPTGSAAVVRRAA